MTRKVRGGRVSATVIFLADDLDKGDKIPKGVERGLISPETFPFITKST